MDRDRNKDGSTFQGWDKGNKETGLELRADEGIGLELRMNTGA